MSNRKKPNALRAALKNKKALRTYFDLAIVDSDQVEAAQRQVDVARQLQAATLLHDDPDVVARADEELAKAQAARAACFHRLYFRGLGFTAFDALVAEHPPTEAQAADGWIWNPDTFNYALLAACAVDSDLTAEEWVDELADADRWSRADRVAVFNMSLAAQQQTMSDAIPKD